MTFGALVPCKECKNGQFYYKYVSFMNYVKLICKHFNFVLNVELEDTPVPAI